MVARYQGQLLGKLPPWVDVHLYTLCVEASTWVLCCLACVLRHIFAISSAAYQHMKETKRDQCIVIRCEGVGLTQPKQWSPLLCCWLLHTFNWCAVQWGEWSWQDRSYKAGHAVLGCCQYRGLQHDIWTSGHMSLPTHMQSWHMYNKVVAFMQKCTCTHTHHACNVNIVACHLHRS